MKAKLLLVSLVLAVCAAGQATPRVQRAAVIPVERTLDRRIERFGVDEPVNILGGARGVYLEGFGLVVSTEVDLIPWATITPFHRSYTKEDIAKLRAKKLDRIAKLRTLMLEALVDAASSIDTVPADQQIAVAVTIFNKSWEDTAGIPGQIVMHATRKALVEYKISTSKMKLEALNAVLKVQEY